MLGLLTTKARLSWIKVAAELSLQVAYVEHKRLILIIIFLSKLKEYTFGTLPAASFSIQRVHWDKVADT